MIDKVLECSVIIEISNTEVIINGKKIVITRISKKNE